MVVSALTARISSIIYWNKMIFGDSDFFIRLVAEDWGAIKCCLLRSNSLKPY